MPFNEQHHDEYDDVSASHLQQSHPHRRSSNGGAPKHRPLASSLINNDSSNDDDGNSFQEKSHFSYYDPCQAYTSMNNNHSCLEALFGLLNNHPDEVDSKAVLPYGLVNKATT